MNKSLDKYSLYITYDGLLDPLGHSQILPYIEGLSSSGYKIVLLSFEKTDRLEGSIKKLKFRLKSKNIEWFYFPFKRRKFGYFIRIFLVFYFIKFRQKYKDFTLFHTRGITTAIIYFICGFKCPLIYDIRAFAGEYIDCGRLNPKSIFAYFLKWFEKKLIKSSAGIVVLDESGEKYIKNKFKKIRTNIKIIPTCCDTQLFPIKDKISNSSFYRFVFLGGARFPYRPDLALILIKNLIKNNITCKIDFINERDQDLIKQNCEKLEIPEDFYNIFYLPQKEVISHLVNYDSGLIFNTAGYWRNKSCPTKLGEYLASGLHIIALSGINVIDNLSKKEPNVFNIFNESDFIKPINKNKLNEIERNIKNKKTSKNARRLAENYFDISRAHHLYNELYKELI